VNNKYPTRTQRMFILSVRHTWTCPNFKWHICLWSFHNKLYSHSTFRYNIVMSNHNSTNNHANVAYTAAPVHENAHINTIQSHKPTKTLPSRTYYTIGALIAILLLLLLLVPLLVHLYHTQLRDLCKPTKYRFDKFLYLVYIITYLVEILHLH
jgi:hypothetical protein